MLNLDIYISYNIFFPSQNRSPEEERQSVGGLGKIGDGFGVFKTNNYSESEGPDSIRAQYLEAP